MGARHTMKSLTRLAPPQRRPAIVWGAFVAAMSLVGGVLVVFDPNPAPRLGPAWAAMDSTSFRLGASITDTKVTIEDGRWLEIVVHDSGSPHGTVESMARQHQSQGLSGLGYHFVIGNGNGMGDGELHVGYRWIEQLAGAHVAGPDAQWHNVHSIGICLVGNGENREFTDRQIERLTSLVTGLQRELGIPAERVMLHRDLAPTTSPGRLFPTTLFREQLLTLPSRG